MRDKLSLSKTVPKSGRAQELKKKKKRPPGIQWLRFQAPIVGGWALIPGQGIRFHMPQLRVRRLQLKILSAVTKTHCSQVNKY